jgi:hypothetical protein
MEKTGTKDLHIPIFFNTIDILTTESEWVLSINCQDKTS